MKTKIHPNRIFRNFTRLQRTCWLAVFLLTFLLSASSSWGQITQRGSATTASAATTNNTTISINKPSGVVAGDVLIFSVVQNETDNDNGGLASPTLTGWTLVKDVLIRNEGTTNGDNAWFGSIYYRVSDGTEGNTFSFQMHSRCDMAIGSMVAFTGVACNALKPNGTTGGPFDIVPSNFNNANSSTATATGVNVANNGSAIIMFAMCNNDRTYSSWSNSQSELFDNVTTNVDDASLGAAWRSSINSGSTGNGTVTLSGSDRNSAIFLVLRRASAFSVGTPSSTPTLCQNTTLTNITHSTVGATGIGEATGLPSGVSAAWASNNITISGTPSASGTFNYSIPLIGGCGSVDATGTIIVNPIPTAVTSAASVTAVCSGVGFNLTSSATSNNPTAVTLLDENFNATPSGWTTVNNSNNGGTPANAAWILRPSGYGVCQDCQIQQNISSNDASQYYLSNSDAQGSGTTATILQSPTFSTVGLASATLRFFHFYRDYNTTDTAFVEISTNGSSWVALNSYTSNQGGPSAFAEVTADLAAYLNQPTVSIRFRYQAVWSYYWAVDNVTVTGTPTTPTYAWTSTPSGFTSSEQNPSGVTQTAATVYTVTVTNSYGCSASASTASVTITPASVGGSVSGTATICSGATSGVLTLSGHTGSVVRWESAVSPFTSWTPITNTATTYTSGPLTEVTKFRAVVSSCEEVYSSEATLSFSSTTWNGTSWVGGEPAANKALVIASNYTSPGSNFDLQGCSLTVQNNAVVTIVPQDSVILSGALTVATGSTMTFEAQAHLIQSGSTNLNSGTVIVKANSAPIKRLDYTLWSAPVAGQQLQAFSPLTLANRFYNYDSNTNFYTVVPSPSTTSFEAAKGVLIRVANTHSATQPQSWAGTFTGVPNSGTYSIPLANFGPGKRFTLVGNPYPSPIDPEAFINNPNNAAAITGTLYLWRKTNGSNKPSYCTFNLGGFITNGEDHSNNVANLPYQVIQTGQGFFVEGTGSGSGNVVFDNTMRIDDHTNSFLRTANTAHTTNSVERNRVWLNVTNTAGAFSQAMIGYVTNATNGFDMNYDGKYINDGEIALASILNAEPYAIQCKALPFSTSDVIPMQFTATTAGTYSIAVDRVDGLFTSGQAVYLRDTVTGTVHNLSEGAYSFAAESGTFNARFEVVFQASTLGVTDPVLNENQVVIYKTPANEISINTGNFVMDNVMIYDLAGRLLFQQKDINNSQALIKVGFATEVLLVKIKTQDGKSVTKKVLFPRTTLKKDLKISTIQVAEDE